MFSTTPNYNVNQSLEVPQGPSDTVSCISWFPVTQNDQTLLAAASWDNSVRVWDVKQQSPTSCQFTPKAMFQHDAPILTCCFSRQNALFSAGCDNVVKMHNLATNQSQVIGKHDAPISGVAFDDEKSICITGSWDQTIRFWDCRQQNPVYTVNLGAKIYAMDYGSPVLVAAASDRNVHVISMLNPQAPPTKTETVLRLQLRAVRLLADRKGMVCGSIEGRCCLTYLEPNLKQNNFAFKCHRVEGTNQKVYPVNSLDFNPAFPTTLVTAGGDGTVVTWEVMKKQRIHQFLCVKAPITQAKFDASGKLMAYSVGYDWHKGYSFSDPSKNPTKLLVHCMREELLRR